MFLCLFCGNNTDDHSWSSFVIIEENGVVVPIWQPVHCTLRKLLDSMAQDFFPGRKVSFGNGKVSLL